MRIAGAVLAATLLLAACGGDDDDGAASTADRRPTSTPASGGEGDGAGGTEATGSSGEGDEATTTTARAAGGAGTAGAPGSSGAASSSGAVAGAPAPATPGVYRYDVDGTSTSGGSSRDLPDTATLRVDAPQGDRQRSVRESKQDDANSNLTETVLQYATDGVHLVRLKTTVTFAGITDSREFVPSPPPLVVPARAQPGDRSEFSMSSTDGSIDVEVTVVVDRFERITVGGEAVDTVVLVTTTRLSGDVEGTSTSTGWVDPLRSLTVKEHSVSDVRFGLGEAHTEYTAVLRQLAPR